MSQKTRPSKHPEERNDRIKNKAVMDELMREIHGIFRLNEWAKRILNVPKGFLIFYFIFMAAMLILVIYLWRL